MSYSESMLRDVVFYQTSVDKIPHFDFVDSLKDVKTRALIADRIDRARFGNFGNHKGVGEGVFELVIDYGPGYRVYYALDGRTVIVILTGSDKSDQRETIKKAKLFWSDYKARKTTRK